MTFKHEPRIPQTIWAVVADRARARILAAPLPGGGEWEEVDCLVHGEGELRPGEVNTDRPGSFAGAGGAHHSGDQATDFRHRTAEVFASEIVDRLEQAHSTQRFGKLALVATPVFLGVLRKKLPAKLAGLVTFELHKDYTQTRADELQSHLQSAMPDA